MTEKKAEKRHHRVTHPSFEPVVVLAEDRLRAIIAAAQSWGVRWTAIARACEVELCPPPEGRKTGQKPPAAAAGGRKGRRKKNAE